MDRHDTLNLKKRYLIWLYKTAKEAQDKIERKFTQLEIDRFILKELEKKNIDQNFISELKLYIQNKEKDGLALKYKDKKLSSDYLFLVSKLKAVEKAIIRELGKKGLKEIKTLYEKEMTQRILKSTEQI